MRILFIFGTRPEAIKMAPLILEARKDPFFDVRVCVTGQHREMLRQVLDFFEIRPDFDMDIMRPNQSLFDVTCSIIKSMENVLNSERPDLVVVQGDTTTAFSGALSAFYGQVPVAHIEAGLRSGDKHSPFPEEMNRALAGRLSDFHFAPTDRAADNLGREGINKNVWVVGNTVIDALFLGLDLIRKSDERSYAGSFSFIDFSKRIVLVTGHRRESFGKPFEDICYALKELADRHENIEIVYPVHLNPNVREPVRRILKNGKRIHLLDPLHYPQMIWLMNRAYMVVTDSGGIQEEAPSLGKPVLVMRDVTERIEGIEAGTCRLVGTDRKTIVEEAHELLTDFNKYDKMAKSVNPYGDGKSAGRILAIIRQNFS
jgi:UDP-N-acetylglucosamine 2-epimerase (non-hydrolysing)